jgi:tripartite-type tricarboxylate transporter receptor subunit TctC
MARFTKARIHKIRAFFVSEVIAIPEGGTMKLTFKLWPSILLGIAIGIPLHWLASSAAAQPSFYQGKTLTIIQGRDPGGTGDLRTKAVATFVQKYLPGNPTVIMEYMPGAGGRKAANHLFHVAKADGLTIGNPSIGMISSAVLGESGVQYDIDKFSYLGSPYSTYHSVFVSRKQAGFNTIEKLQASSGIRIGAQSVGFVTYNEGRLFAYLLGLKDPRFVAAYGGAEIDPALLRGEIDARATGADTVSQRNPDWLEKGTIVDFHAILEVPKGEKNPDFPKVPEIESFAKSELERKVVNMARAFRIAGTPFVLPPGTPKDRVEIVQGAFRKAFQDPEFFREYKKLTGDDPTPLMPELHDRAVREIPREKEVVEVFKKLVGAGPLPSR